MPPELMPLPESDLVAVSWIASIPDLITLAAGSQIVATTLPASVTPGKPPQGGQPAAWLKTGFITVQVVGGNPDMYLPLNKPVVQVDCYAAKPGSNKPPWNMAGALATAVRRACWDRAGTPRLLSISANGVPYVGAVVQRAYMATEFRRVYDDPASYAHLSGDLALQWKQTPDLIDA